MNLLQRAQGGDEGGFDDLFHEFYEPMLRYVRQRLQDVPGRSGIDSEGIVISAFKSLHKRLHAPGFERERWNVAALITTITYRKLAKEIRRRRATTFGPEDFRVLMEGVLASSATHDSEPELLAQLNELSDAAMHDMPDVARGIVAMHLDIDHDHSVSDIARAFDCSEAFVEEIIAEFIERLRRLLEE